MKQNSYWYCAATNDAFELTLFVGDTFAELETWVKAMGDRTSKQALVAAKNGIAVSDKNMFKLMRVNRRSGKILVGKLPSKKKKGKK